MTVTLYHWIGFNVLILFLIGMELRQFAHRPHMISVKEALFKSAGWISLALLFNLWLYFSFGPQHALDFFTGYLMEKSLSVDNLFVFLLLFAHFQVPEGAKYHVLFYGVLSAIIMRALLIWGGIALVHHFQGIFILFGLFLIITGGRLAFSYPQKTDSIDEKNQLKEKETNKIYLWLKKWFPFTENFKENAFFIRENTIDSVPFSPQVNKSHKASHSSSKGRWLATPLFAVLVCIEVTDLIFALDSVPAILGITTEPFIVYTSNIFAILGLRALFFGLAGIIKRFYLLHYAIAFILVFIGAKMTFINFIKVPTEVTLLILVISLATAIIASLKTGKKK